jgi:hypothetical protein
MVNGFQTVFMITMFTPMSIQRILMMQGVLNSVMVLTDSPSHMIFIIGGAANNHKYTPMRSIMGSIFKLAAIMGPA